MFDQSTLMLQTMSDKGLGRVDEQAEARQQANKQFWRVYVQGQLGRFWSRLTGRSNQLEALAGHKNTNGRYAGLQTVMLAHIRGSEGRTGDFDSRFRPLHHSDQARWVGVAAAMQVGIVMPPVQLVQVGSRYFVRDGHHRLSVAHLLGQAEVDAQVSVWEEEGD